MKNLVLATIILLALACPAQAEWGKTDYALEATWLALHVIDWKQTRDIAQHPERYYEMNPALSEHPTTKQVNQYMLLSTAIHFAGSYYIKDEKVRRAWQMVTIGIAATAVARNYSIGIRISF